MELVSIYVFDIVSIYDGTLSYHLIQLMFNCSHKYLVNGEGHAVKSFGLRVQPIDIEDDIVALLDENEKIKMQLPQTH